MREKYDKPLDYGKTQSQSRADYSLPGSNSQLFSGISSKKSCGEHPEEDILYYCFTCKVECICPECVIHGISFNKFSGKHKDHDVKTIKKSHPIIKSEL